MTTPADNLRDRIAEAAARLGHPQWAAAELADAVLAVLPDPARQVLGTPTAPECRECGDTGACNGGPCPLGTPTTDPAPTAPLAEVWAVWREDEPIWAHFATVDDARQGTIDFWQEDEPACPDYSWDRQADGKRLELLVGGEHSGVYASRYRVHGAPASAPAAPADRRRLTPNEHDRAWHAIEGSAGEEGADPGTVLNAVLNALRIDPPTAEEEQAASPSRRLADEAQPTETEGFREWLRRQPVGDQPITLMAPVPLTLAPDATAATEEPQP